MELASLVNILPFLFSIDSVVAEVRITNQTFLRIDRMPGLTAYDTELLASFHVFGRQIPLLTSQTALVRLDVSKVAVLGDVLVFGTLLIAIINIAVFAASTESVRVSHVRHVAFEVHIAETTTFVFAQIEAVFALSALLWFGWIVWVWFCAVFDLQAANALTFSRFRA